MVVVAGLKIRIPTYPNFLPVYKRVSKSFTMTMLLSLEGTQKNNFSITHFRFSHFYVWKVERGRSGDERGKEKKTNDEYIKSDYILNEQRHFSSYHLAFHCLIWCVCVCPSENGHDLTLGSPWACNGQGNGSLIYHSRSWQSVCFITMMSFSIFT